MKRAFSFPASTNDPVLLSKTFISFCYKEKDGEGKIQKMGFREKKRR
jgi:hypothetical protein